MRILSLEEIPASNEAGYGKFHSPPKGRLPGRLQKSSSRGKLSL